MVPDEIYFEERPPRKRGYKHWKARVKPQCIQSHSHIHTHTQRNPITRNMQPNGIELSMASNGHEMRM